MENQKLDGIVVLNAYAIANQLNKRLVLIYNQKSTECITDVLGESGSGWKFTLIEAINRVLMNYTLKVTILPLSSGQTGFMVVTVDENPARPLLHPQP